MHYYSKNELPPYINRYVWVETNEGERLQGYIASVDDQYVQLILTDEANQSMWDRSNRPSQYQPWPLPHRPPYGRPPYGRPPYGRQPYYPYQQNPFTPFLLPLAALTAIGLLF